MYSVRNATSTGPSYLDLEALHVIDAEREDAYPIWSTGDAERTRHAIVQEAQTRS